jgi:flagellar L-ring protein precursor FlgH
MKKTLLILAALPSLASAQDARPAAPSAPAQRAQPVITTQYLMQANGGSLLQASAAQQEPGTSEAPAKEATYNNIYAIKPPEPHVLKKHDLISIVVNESSKSQTTGTADDQRSADFDAKVDSFIKFNLAKLTLRGGNSSDIPEAKFEGSRDFKGQGEYDRSDTLVTRLEAEVIDVKPNGMLVVEAKQHIKIDEEEVTETLTGSCRVQDVDAANSVLSTNLMDLDLQKSTKGQVHDTAKRGLIHRLLDFVNPF